MEEYKLTEIVSCLQCGKEICLKDVKKEGDFFRCPFCSFLHKIPIYSEEQL